jgi:hypothetical protein
LRIAARLRYPQAEKMIKMRQMDRESSVMIQARIEHGRIEPVDPIPVEWEGQRVKILPLTPDDPMADLEGRLAALAALGPMEFDPDEREAGQQALAEMDRLSRQAMQQLAGGSP